MKRAILPIIIIFMFLSSCNNKKQSELIEPEFDVSIHISKDSFITYTIKTNLPDETSIVFSLCDKDADETEPALRMVSGKINNGIVTFGPYENIQDLEPGEYIGQINIPAIIWQEDSVRKILGKYGENLTGAFVKDFLNSKIIETRFNFEIAE